MYKNTGFSHNESPVEDFHIKFCVRIVSPPSCLLRTPCSYFPCHVNLIVHEKEESRSP